MAKIEVNIQDPVLIGTSKAGETRWGFYQFPSLSRMPDGSILRMFSDKRDASETHGYPAPSFISKDEGASWSVMDDQLKPVTAHYTVSKLFDGEFLVIPSVPYLNVEEAGIDLPEPAAVGKTYVPVYLYHCTDLPPAAQEYFNYIQGSRWSPDSGEWENVVVEYDIDGMVTGRSEGSKLLPRTFLERPLLQYKGELLYADYRAHYSRDDGSVAAKSFSSLMVSTDNGRSFRRRSTIAMDPEDKDLMGEPQLSVTADGRLVCVLRRTDQNQKPMSITWSEDSGRTWTPAHDLFEFGVWPNVLLLKNGTLVLSYGRPGVHLAFDPDGTGESWPIQKVLIEGAHTEISKHTCGYTSLLPLDENSFLIAYSDFLYENENGEQCKAIFTRRVEIK